MPIKEAQKTHSQHAVPQNIMDVEFKLIGDLTMRQFTYLLVFALAAYVANLSPLGAFKLPTVLFFILIGLALAFVPIQERGMDEWIINFIKAVYAPTHLLWKKEAILPAAFTYQNIHMVRQELITLAPTSSRRKLEEYLEKQHEEREIDPLDIPEQAFLKKVQDAFGQEVRRESAVAKQDFASAAAAPVEVAVEAPSEPSQIFPSAPMPQESQVFVPFSASIAESQNKAPDVQANKSLAVNEQQSKPQEAPSPQPVAAAVEEQKPRPQIQPIIKKMQREASQTTKPVKRTFPHSNFDANQASPERHVGRRFTNLLPSEGQLILPVRGEVVLQTSEQQNIEEDINKRTDQLRKLLNQIKGDDQFKGIISAADIPQDASSKQKIYEAEDVVNKVKQENEKLSEEIEQLKRDINNSQESDQQRQQKQALVTKLEEEKSKTNADYSALQQQVLELQRRLKEKEAAFTEQPKKDPTYIKMQPITNEPNIISGISKRHKGGANRRKCAAHQKS